MKTVRKNTSRVLALSLVMLALSGAVLAANTPRGIPAPGTPTADQLTDKRPIFTETSIDFGAYDPHGDFGNDPHVKFEHLFLPWEDVDLSTLAIADEYALQRGRSLLITVEPWSWSVDGRVTPEQLLDGILGGRYDAYMASVCTSAASLKSPVIIRWGQEMEDRSGRFSWADWPPQDYIKAYRKVADQFRKDRPTVQIMWSPKGQEDLEKYYPGDDYVDVIGLSVIGLQDYDMREYGAPRTFTEALKPGYERVAPFRKPIWVAELGYEGDANYMQPWIQAATAKNDQFPDLKEVIYFNDRDVIGWPFGLGRPNWRVTTGSGVN